ncbi:MAG: MATE family efflux transporter [Gammaproteobacteria bacterium]|jgi:MATE family multidrug resistance protein
MNVALAELREMVRLGLPLIAAQIFQMGQGVVDAVMAGRLSPEDLAGIAMGGTLLWPTLMFMSGIVMAATPIIAQLNGAGRVGEAGQIVRQGLWIALAAAALLVVFLANAEPLFAWVGVDPVASAIAAPYLSATCFGVPAIMCFFVLRYLCEGLGRTMPAMVIGGVALVAKAVLNYAFVYGELGAPRLGGVGCGWSTAVVAWGELACFAFVASRPFYARTGAFRAFSWPQWHVIVRFLRIGVPIGATLFLEIGVFSLFTLLIGQLGAKVVAAHQIAMNFNGVTFMIPLSLGMAAAIRVGYNVGANRLERARRTAQVAMTVALAYAVLAAASLFWFRFEIVGLYTTEADVLELAATIIVFVAAYQLVDDTQVTAIGALRGYKDTRAPMFIALVGYWVLALPVAVVLAYGWLLEEPWGVYGFWTGLTLGLGCVAVMVTVRLLRLSRDENRVRILSTG